MWVNHKRTLRAVVVVTVGYVVVLAAWALWFRPSAPSGTLPYQLAALVAGFGAALGLSMLVANRRTAEQRQIARNGVEGWATVEEVHPLDDTRSELQLQFTVPGSESFSGRIVYAIPRSEISRFAEGAVVPIMVDPDDHHRVLLLPRQTFDEE
jgi:hypothetical protein